MSQDLSSQVIFQAANNHDSSSGTPPYINTNVPARYFGYYENEHKEQFIFVYDQERKQGTLLMGDYGWDKPVPVIDPLNLEVISDIEQKRRDVATILLDGCNSL